MNTIKDYEKMSSDKLKTALISFEKASEVNELLMDEYIKKNLNISDLKEQNDDYDIDIHLIRMELNKRLWDE